MSHRYFASKCKAVETNAKAVKDIHCSHHTGTRYTLKQPQKNVRIIPSVKKPKSNKTRTKTQRDYFINTMGMQLRLAHNDHMPSELDSFSLYILNLNQDVKIILRQHLQALMKTVVKCSHCQYFCPVLWRSI